MKNMDNQNYCCKAYVIYRGLQLPSKVNKEQVVEER